MRTKVTLVLLFLNIALLFVILKVMPGRGLDDLTREARTRILPASASDFDAVEIRIQDQVTRLVRRDQQWYLSAPVEWPANPHAVNQLLNALRFAEHETAFAVDGLARNGLSLANYGLEQPAIVVTLSPAIDKAESRPVGPITLRIGNGTNAGNNLYVLSADGSRIHVVSRSLADSLGLPLTQLRSEALFTIPEFEVRNFTIQAASGSAARTRLARDGNRWAMESPIQTRADSAAVRQTLVELSGLRLGDFVADPLPPESSPSASPSLRITLEGNNRSETLILGPAMPRQPAGSAATALYASFEWKAGGERKSALVSVTLSTALLDTLRAAQERLRDSRLLDLESARVSAIILRAPGRPELSLQRLEEPVGGVQRWQIVLRAGDAAPLTQPADPEAVSALLERLTRLSADRFVSDAPGAADLESWGFNRPERTVVLRRDGPSPELATLEIGAGQGSLYARTDAARYIYGVDSSLLAALSPDPATWRHRTLRELPAGARITAIRLIEIASGRTLASHDFTEAGAPPPEGAPGSLPKPEAWDILARELRTLRAKSFLSDRFTPTLVLDGTEQPWKYRIEADVSLQTGDGVQVQTQTLQASDRLSGSRLVAGASDLDAVFELRQPAVDALWQLLYGPLDPGPLEPSAQAQPPPHSATPGS